MATDYRPPHSHTALHNVPFEKANEDEILKKFKADFDEFDTDLGHKPEGEREDEPNNCARILRFPKTDILENGAVFWDAKMAIDADGGPNAGGLTGKCI